MARDVFISYSSNNLPEVRGLAGDIESLGHDTWYDHELAGGQRWWDQILQQIRDCDVFVFAVSGTAADSRACLSELTYAEALGKLVLPVTVEPGFAESLLPPSLAQLQRVNYTAADKAAFASLNRALSGLPLSPPLPDVLPEAPPVPASYLFDLKTSIEEPGQMPPERQEALLDELRQRLSTGHTHLDVLALTKRFRQRNDLLLRIDRQLEQFEAELVAAKQAQPSAVPAPMSVAAPSAGVVGSTTTATVAPVAAPIAATPSAGPAVQPAANATTSVSWLWWALVVVFGLIGGAIGFFVHKDSNAGGAKSLLIGGAVSSAIWFFLLSSG